MLIEVFWLRCHPDRGLSYRRVAEYLALGEAPDVTAGRIAGALPGPDGGPVMMHSTSWRHLDDGTIVLTYAVAPDPEPWLPSVRVTRPEVARSASPVRPAPPRIGHEHVAAHAAQHLAFLAGTDPMVGDLLAQVPDFGQALTALPRAPSGQLSLTATARERPPRSRYSRGFASFPPQARNRSVRRSAMLARSAAAMARKSRT